MADLWRGMICLSLGIGFEEDRARLGLPAAVGWFSRIAPRT
jgi:hypothetical protein